MLMMSNYDIFLAHLSYCDRSLSGVHQSVHVSVHPSVHEHLLKKSSPLKPAKRFQ